VGCAWRHTALVGGLALALTATGASRVGAQTHLTSVPELQRALAPGDQVWIVPAGGPRMAGRLTRLGDLDLDIAVGRKGRTPRQITLPFDAIQSLERPRDPLGNGTIIGASIGAALGGVLFAYATAVDRNEIDEWAPIYLRATAMFTGVGALIGRAADAAHSKPYLRFIAPAAGRTAVRVGPIASRGGVGLGVSFSR
jgi:hypothetical protein